MRFCSQSKYPFALLINIELALLYSVENLKKKSYKTNCLIHFYHKLLCTESDNKQVARKPENCVIFWSFRFNG